jgi:alpha-galactosidase
MFKINQGKRNCSYLFLMAVLMITTACSIEKKDWSALSDNTWNIEKQGNTVIIKAGKLKQRIEIDGIKLFSSSMMNGSHELLDKDYPNIKLVLTRANPNRAPKLVYSKDISRAIESTATFGSTDNLVIHGEGTNIGGQVEWVDPIAMNSQSWDDQFDDITTIISTPGAGITRLTLRVRSIHNESLKDVSVSLVYEIYEGYPAIRQWVEVVNNSHVWFRLDRLRLSPLNVGKNLARIQPLTPDDKAVAASIRSFANQDETYGLILGSEAPSATRLLDIETGIMGYADDYFEWILEPAGSFVSEAVSFYAYEGDVVNTVSSVSKPLDRCVEDQYKRFIKDCLGVMSDEFELYAPRYCTWSNYAQYITEDISRKAIPIAARCGFEIFQIDDGWQFDRLGTEPDTVKFPAFDDMCKLVEKEGMDLGLWVSCFRTPGSKDLRVLPNAWSLPLIKRLDGYGAGYASKWRDYYARDLVYLHDRYGAVYFKQDFTNIKLGDMAEGHESRTLKESYLRGLRGLLESQEMIHDMSPDITTLISHEIYWGTPGVPCDLAALKSSGYFHIPPNDYSGLGPVKYRKTLVSEYDSLTTREEVTEGLLRGCWNARQRYYEHRGLPMHMIEYYGAATENVQGALNPEIQDRQVCSFLMGAPVIYAGDLMSLSEDNIKHYRKRFDLLKELQNKYDIYRNFQFSGVPEPTEEDWHWWGKLNEDKEGVVVVIRGSGGEDERKINIPWVSEDQKYKVKQLFSGEDLGIFKGKKLKDGIIEISLPEYGQEILGVTLVK